VTSNSGPAALRRAFASFPSGVTAVCAINGAKPAGMAASSFTPVSLDPPLASICVADTSTTWPMLRKSPRLGISVLAERQASTCQALSARHQERFAEVTWEQAAGGAVFIRGAALWLQCRTVQELPAGDHFIVVFQIEAYERFPGVAPLIFHDSRFRQLAL
jgi:flavin reductase (DIM6/NTAB) family NADH-FMN oxidoreductase RutF